MWLVVVVSMVLPWAPESRLSVYNLLPSKPLQGYNILIGPSAEGGALYSRVRDEIEATGTTSAVSTQLLKGHNSSGLIGVCLVLFWLAGVCFLTVWILAGNMRLLRMVRRTCTVADPEILDLLDDCRRQMNTRRPVRIIVTDQIYGPALFGLIRPCLLLPERILADMNHKELRYILLHELAHLKRHDILVGMVTSALHILHWFNPLVGYGLRRMRADQELACDGLALSRLRTHEASAYGHTVLRLIEQVLRSRSRFSLTGFLGDRARVKQRLAMISRFTKETNRCSPLAIGLIGLLGCIGLTSGRTVDRPVQAQPELIRPTESNALPQATAHEYENIKRIYIYHLETHQYLIAAGNSVDYGPEPGIAGLWEAHFNGHHNRDVLLYSVSEGKYLKTDEHGNLMLSQLGPDAWAYWIIHSDSLGVKVISHAFEHGYLCIDEKGQAKVVLFGRDRGQWEIIQLDRGKGK
jgi:bla regulator protein BlaR1